MGEARLCRRALRRAAQCGGTSVLPVSVVVWNLPGPRAAANHASVCGQHPPVAGTLEGVCLSWHDLRHLSGALRVLVALRVTSCASRVCCEAVPGKHLLCRLSAPERPLATFSTSAFSGGLNTQRSRGNARRGLHKSQRWPQNEVFRFPLYPWLQFLGRSFFC